MEHITSAASTANTVDKYDIFVVYDEGDDFAENDILSLLEREEISFCCTERQGEPGNTRIGNFTELLEKSRKVLFVVSQMFTENRELMFLVNIALDILDHDTQYVITLLTDAKLSNNSTRRCLNQTTNIAIRNESWKTELIRAIRTVPIDFCSGLDCGQVSDHLLFRGLCLQNLRWDMYGLFLYAQDKYLKVDLSEYAKHVQMHENFNSTWVCEQCTFLTGGKTTINLAFRDDFELEELRPVNRHVVRLCERLLCDSSGWLFTCSVTGAYDAKQQSYISDLYAEAKSALETYITASRSNYGKEYVFPEFANEKRRLQTFKDNWPDRNVPTADVMAKSGFIFIGKPTIAQCFSCGYFWSSWDENKNPLIAHAQIMPLCKNVIDNVPNEKIPKEREKVIVTDIAYATYEARIDSLAKLPQFLKGNVTLEELKEIANAGFCFVAQGFFKCFACGICIKSCHLENLPGIWNLHATLSPTCEYLLSIKGKEFVDTVQFTNKINREPTIVTLQLTKLNDNTNSVSPGLVFLPGERYRYIPLY